MPDVFSEEFEGLLSRRVQQICAEHRASRNLLGYFFVDVPAWETSQAPPMASPGSTLPD